VREKMSKVKRVGSPIYTFFPTAVDRFDALGELALDDPVFRRKVDEQNDEGVIS
jgi:hypothetical protein